METKRLTAKKASIAEISAGKYVKKTGFESSYILTRLGRRLTRVRLLGLIVDRYTSPDEKYATMTLDDGTDTMRCKSFINMKIFDGLTAGDLVDVFGKVKEYEGEFYIMPEILRKADPNVETLRILELERIVRLQKERIKKFFEMKKQKTDVNELKLSLEKAMPIEDAESILEAQDMIEIPEEKKISAPEVKSKILKLIETFNKGEGVDYQTLIKESGFTENQVDFAVQDLLESGVCFEPQAGRIRKL